MTMVWCIVGATGFIAWLSDKLHFRQLRHQK
jgi:hypothetical protein